MKFKLLALFIVSISMSAQAASSSTSKASFCSNRKQKSYVQDLLQNGENLLSFTNHGGLLNGGVCWWHSRFTRNAAYLTIYKPNQPKPTSEEAQDLIKQIRKADNVVIIPGFSNLRHFSRYFSAEIQDELDAWQKGDGFIRQQWIVGLAGRTSTDAEKLQEKMHELYEYVEIEGQIAYQKLQLPGVVAHAWLVIGMKKRSNGYELNIVDSNYLYPYKVAYEYGMESFDYGGFGNFVPYIGKKGEVKSMLKVAHKFCQ